VADTPKKIKGTSGQKKQGKKGQQGKIRGKVKKSSILHWQGQDLHVHPTSVGPDRLGEREYSKGQIRKATNPQIFLNQIEYN